MAFAHAKNARVFTDQFDLSHMFNDATMTGKVDMADTTTFAIKAGVSVAKTVIPGVKDGTLQFKGMFDPGAFDDTGDSCGSDAFFNYLIAHETGVGTILTPSNVETCVSVAPEGSWAVGSRVWAAAGVVSQYQIASPVKNAVTIQADLQCDGGVDTGVSLHDAGTSVTPPTPITVAAGVTLPPAAGTLTVSAAPTGYPASGQILVPTAAGDQIITYTGVSGSTFTGCTGGSGTTTAGDVLPLYADAGVNDLGLPQGSATAVAYGATPVGGSGLALTTAPFVFDTTGDPITAGFPSAGQFLCPTSGGSVTVAYTGLTSSSFTGCTVASAATATASSSVTLPPITSVHGAYGFLHWGSTAGVGGGIHLAKLQDSDDNSTWTDIPGGAWTLGTFSEGQYGTGQFNNGGQGGYILFIPAGIEISRYVRAVLAYEGPTTAATVLVTFVRL